MNNAEQPQVYIPAEESENTDMGPLTAAGRAWLSAPVEIARGAGLVDDVVPMIRRTFGLSQPEALFASATALALAVGPAISVLDPFGGVVPVSLHVIWRAGSHPGLEKSLRFLCGGIVGIAASTMQPWLDETEASIEADKLAVQTKLRETVAVLEILENQRKAKDVTDDATFDDFMARHAAWEAEDPLLHLRDPDSQPPHVDEDAQYNELLVLRTRLELDISRLNRKLGMSAFGEIVDARLIRALVADNRDFSYGSFSPTGAALARFMGEPMRSRLATAGFIGAGWSGDPMPESDPHLIYPAVTLAWAAQPAEVATVARLIALLPGFMIVGPTPVDAGEPQGPQPLTVATKRAWESMINRIIERLRLPVTRRTSALTDEAFTFAPEAADLIIESVSWRAKYCVAGSHGSVILEAAPQQIVKIAALLAIDKACSRNLMIDAKTVRTATELYRWLAKSTIEALNTSSKQTSGTGDLLAAITTKLKLAECPLSLRELTRGFHKQGPHIAKALSEGVERGIIRMVGTKFTAGTVS